MKRLEATHIRHKFEPAQVLYLTGDANYSSIHLLNGKIILSSRTLKLYADQWPQFIRIHKTSLVNPEHIHSCIVITLAKAHVIMRDATRLPISRRRVGEVLDQLGIAILKHSGVSKHPFEPGWMFSESEQLKVA
ncbi:LytTR family transcriptional regulator [Spirosoma sp. HMF4905]|uniref:LytTR family transcriptional regulator n=1 Tax=Spirosoma arboris TaxID=2682092 RepID=A0A7K1SF64_9BACT|nr:LytTR family DNA-binding domain-containing protein [Spirosoma arboris]MVM32455.1 LytTR family transcriptional regulator [Spirosoma arboris]